MRRARITLVIIFITILIFNSTVTLAVYSSMNKEIIIDIPSRKLFLIENNEVVKEYPVAVGKSHTPTPIGEYRVINKIVDPYYAKNAIPGGSSRNPLGSRWIGFKPHYGIHGNSNPNSIGTFASAGCVRMFERDVQELYKVLNYNVPVRVEYELIKVLKDVDGENPILQVYPDYYSYKPNISSEIDVKLSEIGLIDKMSQERLWALKNKARNEVTFISNSHTYFINDTYITNDVIKSDDVFYINKNKFQSFFNISINSIDGEDYCAFNEDKIHEIYRDGSKYIAINDLEKVFGGNHKFNDVDLSLKFDLDNYILLNGSLIRGQGFSLIEYPIVPLYDLIEPLNINVKIHRDKTDFFYKGEQLKELYYNDEVHISLDDLVKVFNVKTNIHTSKKIIELYTDPIIIYNDTVFKSHREGNEILVPLSIFSTEYLDRTKEIVNEEVFAIANLKTFDREGKPYVKLEDVLVLKGYEICHTDSYNTKIHLEKRIY